MIRDQQEATLGFQAVLFMASPSGCPFSLPEGKPSRTKRLSELCGLASPKIRMPAW
jgi:hypothetical protein